MDYSGRRLPDMPYSALLGSTLDTCYFHQGGEGVAGVAGRSDSQVTCHPNSLHARDALPTEKRH